jgi:pheromone shutdown protein TraB
MGILRPGIEMKTACESAEKVGAHLEFLGPEFN